MTSRSVLVAGAIALALLTSPIDVAAQPPRPGGVFRIGVPYVKGFKHHDGYDLGRRLTFTWIDRSR